MRTIYDGIITGLVNRMKYVDGSNNYEQNTAVVWAFYDKKGLQCWIETGCTNVYGSYWPNNDGQRLFITPEEFCALLPYNGQYVMVEDINNFATEEDITI